jgi:hypothetical protein
VARKTTGLEFSRGGWTPPKYPWHQWFNGEQWVIRQGEDFDIDRVSMQRTIGGAARARGLAFSTTTKGLMDDEVGLQAFPLPDAGS